MNRRTLKGFACTSTPTFSMSFWFCKEQQVKSDGEKGNYLHQRRWMEVVFTPVCMFVCEEDISKSYGRIWTKLGGQVGCVMWTN